MSNILRFGHDGPSHENNYFFEAAELLGHSDTFIERVSNVIYESQRSRLAAEKEQPIGAFNLHYHYLSVANVISKIVPNQFDSSILETIKTDLIAAFNAPSKELIEKLDGTYLGSLGFVDRYVELVNSDSMQSGVAFDLSYAIVSACSAFTPQMLQYVTDSSMPNPFELTEEEWLSGFVKKTEHL